MEATDRSKWFIVSTGKELISSAFNQASAKRNSLQTDFTAAYTCSIGVIDIDHLREHEFFEANAWKRGKNCKKSETQKLYEKSATNHCDIHCIWVLRKAIIMLRTSLYTISTVSSSGETHPIHRISKCIQTEKLVSLILMMSAIAKRPVYLPEWSKQCCIVLIEDNHPAHSPRGWQYFARRLIKLYAMHIPKLKFA